MISIGDVSTLLYGIIQHIEIGAVLPPSLGGTEIMMIILPAIILLVLMPLVAIWIYRDAEKRGANGVVWVIVFIFLNVFGLFIWLIARTRYQKNAEA